MAAPTWYNQGDQDIYNVHGQHFIPPEDTRLDWKPPLPMSETDTVTRGYGIPYTNAFTQSGGGPGLNASGNAFGYGTAVDSVAHGAWGQPGYSGGVLGDVQQSGWGRQEDEEGGAYLRPRRQLPAIASMALGVLPFGNFLRTKIEDRMNPTYDPNATLGGYKMGGLDATGKGLYNSLASKGMLFEGSSGLKTITGKNFMAKGYVQGQKDILSGIIEKYGSIKNAQDYFADNPKTTNFLNTQLNEALEVTGKIDEQEDYNAKVASRVHKERVAKINQLRKSGAYDYQTTIHDDEGTTTTTPSHDPNVHGGTDYGKGSQGQQSYSNEALGGQDLGFGVSATSGAPVSNRTGRGRTGAAKGGRIGYAFGRGPVLDVQEDENILDFMQDQNIPHGEMAETSPFELRIQELMDTGMSWQEAYQIASEEFGQIAEGQENSFSEEGIASIV